MPEDFEVQMGTKDEDRNAAFAVRIAVFVDEQQIPREEELDALDELAAHCIGYLSGIPVAAGRLVIQEAGTEAPEGCGKIGRMAVLRQHRGRGFGAFILEALEREGVRRGLRLFKLSAQLSARGFYDRAGYEAVGDVYDEVGIPHIAMAKRIQG
jgi:predicted GNAT family N-acyltransferase